MPTSEILNILVTVAVVQLVCDLAANRYVYATENYQRLLGRLSRAQFTLSKEEAKAERGNDKQQRKLKKAQDEAAQASADVSTKHTGPAMYTSIVFFLVYRILATEHGGKVMAVLPFTPWKWIRRFTLAGMEFEVDGFEPSRGVKSPNQACSFLFIYLLCTLSVKFFVSKAIGIRPPKGADGGFMQLMDSPANQRLLKRWNLDKESLKED